MTIFLVDADAATLERMAGVLEGLGNLCYVLPHEAPRTIAKQGGRCVVCLGPNAAGGEDLSWLGDATAVHPCLAIAGTAELAAVQSLLEVGVSRVFVWPAELQRLRGAVGEVVARCTWAARCDEILAGFHRVLRQGPALSDVAEAAARALFGVLEGRPVLVQLWDEGGLVADGVRIAETPETHWVEAERGGEMSSNLFNRRLHHGRGPIGEIVVDLGEDCSDRASALAWLERVAVPAELAAGACIRSRESDRAVHGTLMAIGDLAGSREHGSGQHVRRLAEYVRMLAGGLREDGLFLAELTDDGIDDIVRAVPLHDIGKLAIPDAILLKPGSLTGEEWRLVRTHPETGARVLEEASSTGSAPRFLRLAHEAARDHHERWDGSGYPRGLVGEHIPLVARLLAVAAVYDAVTTPRPYRPARSHERAVDLLAELAGTQLDPRIVESFLARADAAAAIGERMRDDREAHTGDWVTV